MLAPEPWSKQNMGVHDLRGVELIPNRERLQVLRTPEPEAVTFYPPAQSTTSHPSGTLISHYTPSKPHTLKNKILLKFIIFLPDKSPSLSYKS